MIGALPKRPTGTDAEARFAQWVWDSIQALRVIPVAGSAVNRTTRGQYQIPPPQKPQEDGGAKIKRFKIITLANADYVVARAWDGETLGEADVKIAKPPELWQSLASESIDGIPIQYTQRTDNTRHASDGIKNEQQVMFPRYAVNQIVFAVEVENGTGVEGAEWLELKPARVWTRRYIQ